MARACLGVAALLGGTAHADLIHRYSFNTDGQAEDTGTLAVPGFTDGTPLNGGVIAGGILTTTDTGSGVAGTNPEVTLPLFVASDITSSFTIESFFSRSATAANNYSTLFSFSDGTTNNYVLVSPGRGDGTNQLGFAIKQAGVNAGAEILLRGHVLAPGSSNVLAGTFNGGTGQLSLFINGVAVSQSNLGQATGLNLSNMALKAGINGNGPFGDRGLAGSTDDFRLYNNALTATDVARSFLEGSNKLVTVANNNGIASGDYNDLATWDDGVPTATQFVTVNNTKTLSSGTGLAGILRIAATGTLNIDGGTLAPATNLDLAGGATVNLNAGTLSLRGLTVDGDLTSSNAAAHTINLNGGTLQAAGTFFAPATNISLNVNTASTIDSNGNSFSLPGKVTGSAAINKIGAGTVAFTGDTTAYTGLLNARGGVVGLSLPAGRTGVNAFSNPVNLDPANTGATGIGFLVTQANATEVISTVTLGQPAIATSYAIAGGAGTNQNFNFLGKITGGNSNTTVVYSGFFKLDTPTSDYQGKTQMNSGTSIAIAGPASFGGANRALIANSGGIEPQTATSLSGVNKLVAPITVLANQAIFFNGQLPMEYAGVLTGTLSGANSVSDLQKTGAGTLTLSGSASNLRNIILSGAGGTAANPRVIRFTSNYAGTNPTTNNNATGVGVRGSIFDDNQGGNNDVQYAELAGGVTVSNFVLASKGRSLPASPAVAGIALNNASGDNTWSGGLQIVNGGGGHRVNIAAGSLTVGGVVNNNVGGSNRGYELTGSGNGIFNATVLDGTQYNATAQAASQIFLSMIGETTGTATTGNGSWSLNSTGNTFSGGLYVVNGRFNVNGSMTSTSAAASNTVNVYGGSLGGNGSIQQPVTVHAPGQTITSGATAPFLATLSTNPTSATMTTLGGRIDPGSASSSIGTLTLNGTYAANFTGTGSASSDLLSITGALTLGSSSTLSLTGLGSSPDDAAYVLATYGSRAGTFTTITGLPTGYSLAYDYGSLANAIALVRNGPALKLGDFDFDGEVGFGDISNFELALSESPTFSSLIAMYPGTTPANYVTIGDFDADGELGFGDISGFENLLAGGGLNVRISVTAVPEPTSAALLLPPVVAIGLGRRRRQ